MPPSRLDTGLVSLTRSAWEAHVADWDAKRNDLKLFRNLYASRYYGDTKGDAGTVRVETGDGPAHIESYLASLFSRAPAVEVGADRSRPDLNAAVPQALINAWIARQRPVFEQATRLALIYPMAFLRVGPCTGLTVRQPTDSVEVRAVAPWDVILDTGAPDFAHMRWIGHRYTLPLAQAREVHKNVSAASWKPQAERRFFDSKAGARSRGDTEVPDELKLVTIIEFYDLVRNKLVFWSPDKDHGETAIKIADIPLRRPGTQTPKHPLVPLYFAYEPDAPVNGISTLSRSYDLLREKNALRTNAANCIRRDTRQYLAREDSFEPEEATKITAGVDGAVIFVKNTAEKRPLNDMIHAVPVSPMSSNYQFYGRDVEQDIQKASVLASFVRGEATRATATEIGVLQAYSASAIGRMARERDGGIEGVGELYLAHLILSGGADGVLGKVEVGGQLVTVTRDMLDAEWSITALDQAGTPMSKAIEQQRFIQLVPVLQAMKVSPAKLMREMVRLELVSPDLAEPDPVTAGGDGGPTQGASPTTPGSPTTEGVPPTIDELIRMASGAPAGQAPGSPLGDIAA